MKIAYLFHADAADPAVQSGYPASILSGLRRQGAEIEAVFPLVTKARSELTKKIYYRMGGFYHRADREPDYLKDAAAEFTARTSGKDFDLVFSPGSELIAHLETAAPLTFCADATFASMLNYYWDFSRLSSDYIRKGHAQEAAALERAALAIYPTAWAARSAIQDYGVSESKVAIIPFGANQGRDNTSEEVEGWIAARPRDELRLLFVGRHWDRKGGELVVNAAYCLAKLGHRVRVDVVGCKIPARHRNLPWLHGHGLLRINAPAQLARLNALFASAHYLFVPSRAETFGITYAEAGAFGVPSVATDTGGISGVIENGVNGHLLPIEAEAPDYADVIVTSFDNRENYLRLCRRSFDRFKQRLNWEAFSCDFVRHVTERGLANRSDEPSAEAPPAEPITPCLT